MFPFVTHTWNLVRGECPHGCRYCYMWGHPSWNEGPHLVAAELKICPLAMKQEARVVFIGSSTDLFADEISDEMITSVLQHLKKHHPGRCCKRRHKNSSVQYLFCTKNPGRYQTFIDRDLIPAGSWLGVTIETNRPLLFGKVPISKAPDPEERFRWLKHLGQLGWPTLLSIEPVIRFDEERFLELIVDAAPVMVAVGVDSRNDIDREVKSIPEPRPGELAHFIDELASAGHPPVLKKNILRLLPAARVWDPKKGDDSTVDQVRTAGGAVGGSTGQHKHAQRRFDF